MRAEEFIDDLNESKNTFNCESCEVFDDEEVDEEKASRALCKSAKSNSALGASAASSCKAQGLRPRESDRIITIGKERKSMRGKKIKSVAYGGPVKDYPRK